MRTMYGVLAVGAALMMCVGVAVAAKSAYTAHLSAPDSLATGQTVVRVARDGESLTYRLIVADLDNVTAAHIHVAAVAGGDGPPVLWLYPAGPPPVLIPGTTNGVLAEGAATASDLVGPLAGGTLADLVAAIEEGRAYVNVHTQVKPGGAIRGDLQ